LLSGVSSLLPSTPLIPPRTAKAGYNNEVLIRSEDSDFSPLSSFDGDWADWGALCTRAMTGSEAKETTTYPVVLINPADATSTQIFENPPDRFKSRFHAVGYYLDPSATAGVYTGSTSVTESVAESTACTATAPALVEEKEVIKGVSAGAVAGVAVGSMLAGVALGAVVVWIFFKKRREAHEEDTRLALNRAELEGRKTQDTFTSSELESRRFSGMELEDTSPMVK
jgi:hypothetical protein